MKHLSVFLLLCYGSPVMGQLFVDGSATGNNDGSSWEHAYTDLQSALVQASDSSDIWIATGTYLPSAEPDSLASFFLDKALQLYGGFAGGENSLGERDVLNNPTILSGDILGNDLPGAIHANRADNVFNVLRIDSSLTQIVVVDGLIISGGSARGNIAEIEFHGRGGGIYSQSPVRLTHCRIEDNYALHDGGGIYLAGPGTAGSQLVNCEIRRNVSDDDGGGLEAVFNEANPILLDRCLFTGNSAMAIGGGIHLKAVNAILRHCRIDSNRTEGFGGGLHVELIRDFHNLQVEIHDSYIEDNYAENRGGGMVYYNNDSANVLHITGTRFAHNNSQASGGGLYMELWTQHQAAPVRIQTSEFLHNHAPLENGGAIYLNAFGINSQVELDSLLFANNTCALQGGGMFARYSQNGPHLLQIHNSHFMENLANFGGGLEFVTQNRSAASLSVSQSYFQDNKASTQSGLGGGLNIVAGGEFTRCDLATSHFDQNESFSGAGINVEVQAGRRGELSMRNLNFTQNQATSRGAGINMRSPGGTVDFSLSGGHFSENSAAFGGGMMYESEAGGNGSLQIDTTLFLRNTASVAAGGMLYLIPEEFSGGTLSMTGATFRENTATENVGGLAISSASGNFRGAITHSRFIQNSSATVGALFAQSAISFPTTSSLTISNSLFAQHDLPEGVCLGTFSFPLNLTNCTIADNESVGIQIEDQSTLTLQNTLLHNPGQVNFKQVGELGSVISLGGNLSSDASLGDYRGSQDLVNVMPLFIGGDFAPYRLQENSPGIDKGAQPDSVPELDLSGVPRIQGDAIDIGAYEGSFAVFSRDAFPTDHWELYPNPVQDRLYLKWGEAPMPQASFSIWDIRGKRLEMNNVPYTGIIELGDLAPGIYWLSIGGTRQTPIPFVKQ